MINDIFKSLPQEVRTNEVEKAIERSYWRGVQNHIDEPKYTEKLRLKRIVAELKKTNCRRTKKKQIITIDKIEKILMQYAKNEMWFNEAHNQLCDLHNDMIRSRNKWELAALIFIGFTIGQSISIFF